LRGLMDEAKLPAAQ